MKISLFIFLLLLSTVSFGKTKITPEEFIGCYYTDVDFLQKFSKIVYDAAKSGKGVSFNSLNPSFSTASTSRKGFYLPPGDYRLNYSEIPKVVEIVDINQLYVLGGAVGLTSTQFSAFLDAASKALLDVACCPALSETGSCGVTTNYVHIPGFGYAGYSPMRNQILFDGDKNMSLPFSSISYTPIDPSLCTANYVNPILAEAIPGGKCDVPTPTCNGTGTGTGTGGTVTPPPLASPTISPIAFSSLPSGGYSYTGSSSFVEGGQPSSGTGVSRFYRFSSDDAFRLSVANELGITKLYSITMPSVSNLSDIEYTLPPGTYLLEHSSNGMTLPLSTAISLTHDRTCSFTYTLGTTQAGVMYFGNGATVCTGAQQTFSFTVAPGDTGTGKMITFKNVPVVPNTAFSIRKGNTTIATGTSAVTLDVGLPTAAGDYILFYTISSTAQNDIAYNLVSERWVSNCSTKPIATPYWSETEAFTNLCRSVAQPTKAAKRFSFTLATPQRIGIRALNSLAIYSNPYLYVYGSDGVTLLYEDDNGSKDKDALVSKDFAAGTYVFEVADIAWTNGGANREFKVVTQPVTYTGTCGNNITVPLTAGSTPFQIDGKALTACASVKKTPVRGAQFFTFTPTTSVTAHIYASAIPSLGEDLIMYLSSGSKTGAQLAFGDGGSGTSTQDAYLTYSLVAGTTYVLEVTSYNFGKEPAFSLFIQTIAP